MTKLRKELNALVMALVLLLSYTLVAQTTFTENATTYNLNIGGSKDGGHAWADYDGDGDLDVLVNINSTSNRNYLMRNNRINSPGVPSNDFTNVQPTLAPGMIAGDPAERSAAWGDLNNDGRPDFIMNSHGNSPTAVALQIFIQNPSGTFGDGIGGTAPITVGENASATITISRLNTEGLGFFDFEGDGDLDIFFDSHNYGIELLRNNYIDHTTHAIVNPAPASLYTHITTGDGAGVVNFGLNQFATDGDYGTAADVNDDGWVDIFMRKRDENDFFLNQGGTFTSGSDLAQAENNNKGGNGLWDLDNDGDLDAVWTENGTTQIFRNDGPGVWTSLGGGVFPSLPQPSNTSNTTSSAGIDALAGGDIDNDGDIDILLVGDSRSYLYINQLNSPSPAPGTVGSGTAMTFTLDGTQSFNVGADGEGTTMVDIDDDGDLDIYMNINGGSNRLYINNLPVANRSNHLIVDVSEDRNPDGTTGGFSGRTAIGTNVLIKDCNGNIVSGLRQVNGSFGHGTQQSPHVHFGLPLGENQPYLIEVHYPNLYNTGAGTITRLIATAVAQPSTISGTNHYKLTTTDAETLQNPNAPIANDDLETVPYGNTISVQISLFDNDSEPDGDNFFIESVTQPALGSVVIDDANAGLVTYTYSAATAFTGTTFTYTISDATVTVCPGSGKNDTATVTVFEPCSDSAGKDTDGDGINDICDLDDDNDGILDSAEIRCDQLADANSNSGTGILQDQLYFFNWDGADFANGLQVGDTKTFNLPSGLQIVATVKSVSGSGSGSFVPNDMATWPGASFFHAYNTAGTKEAFYGPQGNSIDVTMEFVGTKNGNPFPIDLLAFDPEATGNNEQIIFTSNGENWEFVETIHTGTGGTNGTYVVSGQTLTANETYQTGSSLYVSNNASEIRIQADGSIGRQGLAYGIFLRCDIDADGIPNNLDLDSDGDGIPDNVEAQTTTGYTAPSGTVDANGVFTNYTNGLTPTNTDGTDNPDFLDLDSDNEGGNDTTEAGITLANSDNDGDGLDDGTDATANYSDPGGTIDSPLSGSVILTDVDNDANSGGNVDFRDAIDNRPDNDSDGIADVDDLDDDNDGILDTDEGCGNLVMNGNFEAQDFSSTTEFPGPNTEAAGTFIGQTINAHTLYGWNITQNIDGWVGNQSISWSPHTFAAAYRRNQYLDVIGNNSVSSPAGENNILSQVISTEIGQTYTFSFYWGEDVGHAAGTKVEMDVDVLSSTNVNLLSQNLTTTAVGVVNGIIGPRNWFKFEQTFVATTTTTTLRFRSTPDGTANGTALDYVSVFKVGACQDTDGDGVIDAFDLDSDNDGIVDAIEAGHGQPQTNGVVNGPVGTDGLPDSVQDNPNNEQTNYTLGESPDDADTIPDFLDIDADGDGIPDNIEAQTTAGYIAPSGQGAGITDANNNGIDDNYDSAQGGTNITPENTDSGAPSTDAIPDYLDRDSDNDGIDDLTEAGYVAGAVTDADNDGLADAQDDVNGADVNDDINDPTPGNLTDTDGDVSVDGSNAVPLINDLDYRDNTLLPTFVCNSVIYLGRDNGASATALRDLTINPTSFTISDVGNNTHGFFYNAMGYNPIDDYIYAIETGTNALIKIGADGSTFNVGTITGLPVGNYDAGEIDDNGNFYVKASGLNNVIYTINVTNLTASSTNLSQAINIGDFAYNITNNLLYGIQLSGANAGTLMSINPTTGAVNLIGGTSGVSNIQTLFASNTGEIYGELYGGAFYQFNTTNGNRVRISSYGGTNYYDGAHCVTAPISWAADLEITKTDGTTTYSAGGTTTYTIVARNTGSFGVMNAAVADAVPAGIPAANMSYTAVASGGSSTNVVGTQTGAINDLISLPHSGTVTYTVTITIPTSFTGNLVNTATITSPPNSSTDPDPANNIATDTDTQASSDLIVGKSVDNANPLVGTNVTFTIALFNDISSLADLPAGAQITDVLPTGYTYVNDNAGGAYAGGVWTAPAISIGGVASFQIVATVNVLGNYTNTAELTYSPHTDPDSTPGNGILAEDDQDTATTNPVNQADLSLTKAVNDSNPDQGDDITFTITITNNGPSSASTIEVKDIIPTDFTYTHPNFVTSQGTVTFNAGTRALNWNLGAYVLTNGSSLTLTYTVTVDVCGEFKNQVEIINSSLLDTDSTPNNGQ